MTHARCITQSEEALKILMKPKEFLRNPLNILSAIFYLLLSIAQRQYILLVLVEKYKLNSSGTCDPDSREESGDIIA